MGEAYEKIKKMNLAIDEYKYIIEHSKDSDLALRALGDAYLKPVNMMMPLSTTKN